MALPSCGSAVQVKLLVWIFVMRVHDGRHQHRGLCRESKRRARAKYEDADEMDFESPLTWLVWLTSIISVAMTYVASWLLIHDLGDGTLWWKLATIISCGTLAGAIIPELVKDLHVDQFAACAGSRRIVARRRRVAQILSGLTAGNFSAFWMGLSIVALMAIAYGVSTLGAGRASCSPRRCSHSAWWRSDSWAWGR